MVKRVKGPEMQRIPLPITMGGPVVAPAKKKLGTPSGIPVAVRRSVSLLTLGTPVGMSEAP